MRKPPTYGHIAGVPAGSIVASRAELMALGLHRDRMKGISYGGGGAADAIVISGGYEDDDDRGDWILYTGEGGRSSHSEAQIDDQRLQRGNLALARTCLDGLPLRVIRGAGGEPTRAPAFGCRYDGLYRVERFWHERGISGHAIWRYLLIRIREEESVVRSSSARLNEQSAAYGPAMRTESTIQRIVRSSDPVQRIKALHDYRCQICGTRLETLAGAYAEGAHIRPLGAPHDGPDTADNILCLCPNCHVRLDFGAIVIDPELQIRETATGVPQGMLRTHPEHPLERQHLAYHRALFARIAP